MDLQSIGTGIGGLLVIIGAAYTSWNSRVAKKKATTAAEQTAKTGNGFADDVLNRLNRIEEKGDQTHQLMVDHLRAHTNHDLAGAEASPRIQQVRRR